MAAASVLVACDKPVVATGTEATVGGVKFSVGEYEVRYLEVVDGANTYEYPQPALVIPVTLTNVGEGDFAYASTHSTQSMAEAQTPLLYIDPGAEEDLPPESKTVINGVYLQKGTVKGQVTENTSIKKGESLTDMFLFEVPDPSVSKLVLSLPPSMHRGKFPVLFRIPYAAKEAAGPKVYETGEPVALGPAAFTVTGTDVQYVKTTDSGQGEGFSSDPLLRVDFEIKNTSDAPITYRPSHRDVGGRGASLFGAAESFKRVKFSATTIVEGQKDGAVQLAPGDSVKDFVLFERPTEGTQQLNFEYPAALFGGSGIARVKLDYEYANPPLPEELQKKEKPKEDDSKGG